MVFGLADRDDRAVLLLRSKAGHRVGEVGGRHDEPDARDLHRGGGVDRDDPGPRAIDRDELGFKDIGEPDVRDVFLQPGDSPDAADTVGRRSNETRVHR